MLPHPITTSPLPRSLIDVALLPLYSVFWPSQVPTTQRNTQNNLTQPIMHSHADDEEEGGKAGQVDMSSYNDNSTCGGNRSDGIDQEKGPSGTGTGSPDCSAGTHQGGSGKLTSAQVQHSHTQGKWHLVRSRFPYEYCGVRMTQKLVTRLRLGLTRCSGRTATAQPRTRPSPKLGE
jgi:hypothetical protein